MYRRAYVLLVGSAVVMGAAGGDHGARARQAAADPEGFLGPSWLRLPLLLIGAFLLDLRAADAVGLARQPEAVARIARERVRTHWTRERLTLVVLGIVCFYITYVSYRNLKSFLPFVREKKYDCELHLIDQALFFGHEPGVVLHDAARHRRLGARAVLHLPVVPAAGAARGDGLAGVVAQHLLRLLVRDLPVHRLDPRHAVLLPAPDPRPGLLVPWLYEDVIDAGTPTSDLMDSLSGARERVLWQGVEGAVQSIAGFASLHVAITLLVALMVQYTLRSRVVHWVVLGQLRAHRRRHPLLRLALRRRRRRRHPDRAGRLLPRRPRQRAGFERHGWRRTRPPPPSAVPVDVDRSSSRVEPVPRELQPCSSSSRHAGDLVRFLRFLFPL